MKKRSVASLIAVAAVATSIGTSATAYKGAVEKNLKMMYYYLILQQKILINMQLS